MVIKIFREHVNDIIKLEEEVNEFIIEKDKEYRDKDIYSNFKVDTHIVPQWTMIFKSSDGDINQSVEEPVVIAVVQY